MNCFLYVHGCAADWELWLTADAQAHKSIVTTYLASFGKDQNQNSKYSFY